jgi:alpha-L-rhamnosidase
VPAAQRDALADRLVASLEDAGHLRAGFLSVAHLMPLLSSLGRSDLAYRLLLRTDFPSWLYPVTIGATTIWERWDGWTADRGFQDVGMNSFNHYAFGAVAQWMHEHLAGIRIVDAAPGYREVLFAPEIHDGIGRVSLRLQTIRGAVASKWERRDDGVHVEVEVPAGSTGAVVLGSGARAVDGSDGVRDGAGRVRFEVGSGIHRFELP